MEIDLENCTATLSVRELAEFNLGPTDAGSGFQGLWRAEAGSAWHTEIQSRAATEFPNAETLAEVPLSVTWMHQRWALKLQGRIDQLILEGNSALVREIKTVRGGLPADADKLRASYPEYFAQAAIYATLLPLTDTGKMRTIRAELVFVALDDSSVQVVPLEENEPLLRFEERVDRVSDFLNARLTAKRSLKRLAFFPAFEKPRPGQEHTLEALDLLAHRHGTVFFEAPTGFGKTGIALQYALQKLRDGHIDRVIYLTGKTTGQMQVVKQLGKMAGQDGLLRYFQMRKKSDLAIASRAHTCDERGGCREGIEEKWRLSGIMPPNLFRNGTVEMDDLRALGASTGVCPYEIAKSLLPFAEVWVADYNYLFSPRHSGLFENVPGYLPEQTLLIIDEAHNLPARVADAWSGSIDADLAERVMMELRSAKAPPLLQLAWEQFSEFIAEREPTRSLDLTAEYELKSLIAGVSESLFANALDHRAYSGIAWDTLWDTVHHGHLLEHPNLEKLLSCPKPGSIDFTCLSAAPEISKALEKFGSTLIMSATLSPIESFRTACGLEPSQGAYLRGEAPWRDGAYDVAVDLRVDTRYRTREQCYPRTADTVLRLADYSDSPVAVFFSSYRYAEAIREFIQSHEPYFNIALQPRGVPLEEQTEWIEQSLNNARAIFLVLGSGFGEGIDALGGRVTHAMVVGPALPEVNAAQETRLENRAHLGRDAAFREVYLIPAMVKVHQALGRMVRAPGHKAKILLHCRRFAETACNSLLMPEYQNGQQIRSDGALHDWLSS